MDRCAYCDTMKGLRISMPSFIYRGKRHPTEWICEACFTPQDEGPCFDDLPTSEEPEPKPDG